MSAPFLTRRSLIGVAGFAAVALSTAACSTGSATDSNSSSAVASNAFPATIKHVFGETVIKVRPEKVATVAWSNDDVAIALGVIPVAIPKNEWGGNDKGSTPWKDAALEAAGATFGGSNAPTQFSEAEGINFTEIAKAAPDIILAAYSGLTQEEYDKLSKIAPVVAYPELAYGTPWQETTRIIGQALGKSAEADQLVASVEQQIAKAVADYPQLQGKTFIYGDLQPAKADGVSVYTANDNRPRFLTGLGLTLAPVVAKASEGSEAFFLPWSPEKANELESDIFLTSVPDAATTEAIKGDSLLGQIPAVQSGALVADSDNTLTLSISAASPLSLPWALERFLPLLGEAADAADKK